MVVYLVCCFVTGWFCVGWCYCLRLVYGFDYIVVFVFLYCYECLVRLLLLGFSYCVAFRWFVCVVCDFCSVSFWVTCLMMDWLYYVCVAACLLFALFGLVVRLMVLVVVILFGVLFLCGVVFGCLVIEWICFWWMIVDGLLVCLLFCLMTVYLVCCWLIWLCWYFV